jgi:hypothetical protein
MIDIKNIKSIKVVKSNSPIADMEDVKKEGMRRRNIHPNLTTLYLKY